MNDYLDAEQVREIYLKSSNKRYTILLSDLLKNIKDRSHNGYSYIVIEEIYDETIVKVVEYLVKSLNFTLQYYTIKEEKFIKYIVCNISW